MTLKVADVIEVESPEDVKPELKDYLDTYVQQHNALAETYKWIREKLEPGQRHEWERTIKALSDICRALAAGFDPCTPPRNWASGTLLQYLAPIPRHVREGIDKAEPIFTRSRILIYDPNKEHFSRPKQTDPLAVGFVDLAEQRLHFMVGHWDLNADLKFIQGEKAQQRARRAARDVDMVVNQIRDGARQIVSEWQHQTAFPTVVDVGGYSNRTGDFSHLSSHSRWVKSMTAESANKYTG